MPRTKMLTIPQAWRRISRRIAENKWNHYGLCSEVRWAWYKGMLTEAQENTMLLQVNEHLEVMKDECELPDGAGYLDSAEEPDEYGNFEPMDFTAPERAETRVLFALFLALEAEEYG